MFEEAAASTSASSVAFEFFVPPAAVSLEKKYGAPISPCAFCFIAGVIVRGCGDQIAHGFKAGGVIFIQSLLKQENTFVDGRIFFDGWVTP